MHILQAKVEVKKGNFEITLFSQRRGKKVVGVRKTFPVTQRVEMFAWLEEELNKHDPFLFQNEKAARLQQGVID